MIPSMEAQEIDDYMDFTVESSEQGLWIIVEAVYLTFLYAIKIISVAFFPFLID